MVFGIVFGREFRQMRFHHALQVLGQGVFQLGGLSLLKQYLFTMCFT